VLRPEPFTPGTEGFPTVFVPLTPKLLFALSAGGRVECIFHSLRSVPKEIQHGPAFFLPRPLTIDGTSRLVPRTTTIHGASLHAHRNVSSEHDVSNGIQLGFVLVAHAPLQERLALQATLPRRSRWRPCALTIHPSPEPHNLQGRPNYSEPDVDTKPDLTNSRIPSASRIS
jgi:hypothetical protein